MTSNVICDAYKIFESLDSEFKFAEVTITALQK